MQHRHSQRISLFVLLTAGLLVVPPTASLHAKSFFEDGFLGLTQEEVHAKLGIPHAIRSRKSALRVFSYYSPKDWKKYFSKLVSPQNGEDVYTYSRNGVQVRYSFVYKPDFREAVDFPTLHVKRVEVEFTPSIPLKAVPALVREFNPSIGSKDPAFRSNLWVLLFKGPPSKEAELVVEQWDKEDGDWSLAYQLFSVNGLPNYLTVNSSIDRLEFTVQSLSRIHQIGRHTHEPMVNPYSPEFAQRPPEPPKPKKSIPVPVYAE
ncbi:MAG: hypothetical protein OXB94_13070 [Nitrospira sp.]|nr:hypothetical protein [Nitrospira sp.]